MAEIASTFKASVGIIRSRSLSFHRMPQAVSLVSRLTARHPARKRAAHMTANELFLAISPALATRILDDVHGSDKELYRVALHAVAQARKVRPLFLERQSRAERHRLMASALWRNDMETIAGNLVSGWLVKS